MAARGAWPKGPSLAARPSGASWPKGPPPYISQQVVHAGPLASVEIQTIHPDGEQIVEIQNAIHRNHEKVIVQFLERDILHTVIVAEPGAFRKDGQASVETQSHIAAEIDVVVTPELDAVRADNAGQNLLAELLMLLPVRGDDPSGQIEDILSFGLDHKAEKVRRNPAIKTRFPETLKRP